MHVSILFPFHPIALRQIMFGWTILEWTFKYWLHMMRALKTHETPSDWVPEYSCMSYQSLFYNN